jgi:hypothetical protein
MSEEQRSTEVAIPDLSEAIGKIMEHPELISMVASVLGGTPPSQGDQNPNPSPPAPQVEASKTTESAPASSAPPADVMASIAPVLTRLSALGSHDVKDVGLGAKDRQLLCALKPYLSDSRKSAIDYILKISQMSGLLKGLR